MATEVHGRRVAVLFHESEALGAGLSVLRAASRLREGGWAFAGWFPGDGPIVEESAAVLDWAHAHEKPIAYTLRGWRRPPGVRARLVRTPRYLRALRDWLIAVRPDVVHANSLLMVAEASVARRLGLPVVTQVHEMRPHGLKYAATIRWGAAVSDVLVGVCRTVSAALRESAGRTPVRTVYNGVDIADREHRVEEPIVGTVGYVSRGKGTDVFLLAAMATLRERPALRFEHIGQPRLWDDDEFDRHVDELAASSLLRGRFSFLGRSSVPDALSRWEMFTLASRSEAFPLSTLEAMAAGLPVIATKVGGAPEQIEHLTTGVLVPPDDPQALADWMIRLHDDAALRTTLGSAARDHVRKRFSLAGQARGLELAYEEAMQRSEAR